MYSHVACSPGPTAPIHWMEECVLGLAPEPSVMRQKILLGLNFYGYDFTSSGMDREHLNVKSFRFNFFLFFSSNCWTQVCNLSHGIYMPLCIYVCYRYIELLREHKPKFKWDSDCGEHYFKYK